MPRSVLLAISLLFVAVPALSQSGEATFEGLGDLPGGDFESEATAVSTDGSVVVGQSDSGIGLIEAFRWVADPALRGGENGQMEGLGDLPGGQTGSWARDVSNDGSVVIGVSNSNNGNEAFRWEGGVMQGLGELPGGGVSSNGFGVSGDGAVAVGASSSENGLEGFRWEDGEMEPLGTLPGGNTGSWAYGISTDGSTIVGFAGSENGSEGFRWVDGEMEGLGLLPGGSNGTAYDVSADGSVVVGRGDSDNAFFEEAFRWEDGVMVGLGDIDHDNGVRSQARAVSADGSVIVGEGNMTTFDGEAFVWTEEWGVRSVKEVLENDYGLDLTGWELDRSTGVSADGTVIVGTGVNPDGNVEAWCATGLLPVADEISPEEPANILSPPRPNPTYGTSTISVTVERGQEISVGLYDMTGRRVQTHYEGLLIGGVSETLVLDASALPAGTYLIRATGNHFTRTQRITILH